MAFRRTAVLAALLVLSGAATAAAAEPRPGVLLTGAIQFPRAQNMSIQTDPRDGTKLSVAMGFDGKCRGGGLGELWASNVQTAPELTARNGRFVATLTGMTRDIGGVNGRNGVFRWRVSGRFIEPDVVTAKVTGSAEVRIDGKAVSKCRIAKPATVRLAIRSL